MHGETVKLKIRGAFYIRTEMRHCTLRISPKIFIRQKTKNPEGGGERIAYKNKIHPLCHPNFLRTLRFHNIPEKMDLQLLLL
jgi:hypothetical protein